MAQFVQRGQQLIDRGQHQEAVRVCRLGLLASPTEVAGRLVLGSALMALKRYDEVLAEMRVAIEMAPDSVRAQTLKAEALLEKGDALQAREVVARALELDPADPDARALSGRVGQIVGGSGRGARATSDSFLDPLESETKELPQARGRSAIGSAPQVGSAGDDSSGTIELDPDLEGVEVEPGDALARASVGMTTGSIELETSDVELLEGSEVRRLVGDDTGTQTNTYSASIHEEPTAFSDVPRPTLSPASPADEPSGKRGRQPDGFGGGGTSVPTRPGRPLPNAVAEPDVDALFPENPSGVSRVELRSPADEPNPFVELHDEGTERAPMPGGPVRARSDDMRLIRKGLGMDETTHGRLAVPDAAAKAAAGTVKDGARERRPRRPRKQPLAAYALVALVVISGAVYAGLKVRNARLERDVQRAVRQASADASSDTYLGYLKAAAAYSRIAAVRGDAASRAALARAEAAVAAEFSEHLEAARAAVKAIASDPPSRNGRAARALLALAEGDTAGARARASDFAASHADDELAGYLEGRAAMLSGNWPEAVARLRIAQGVRAAPRVYVRLGQAQAGLGKYPEAIAAFESALRLVAGHPAAVIEEARARARAGKLGQQASDYVRRVKAVIAEGERPASEQTLGVAPAQRAWAYLVLAEVQLADGQREQAQESLELGLERRVDDDFGFSDAVVGLYLDLGMVARAQAEAERSVARWPDRGRLRIAEIALARGNAQKARDTLDAVRGIAQRPAALALRGKARLMLDDVDGAAKDLDAALEASPRHRGALLARAELDLRRGDARGAIKRLGGIYRSDPRPEVANVYARALRVGGELDKAGDVLAKLAETDTSPQTFLEVARLARALGDFQKARDAYAKAIEADPEAVVARLESALLAFDVGDSAGATEAINVLIAEAGEDATVLAEAARVRSLTGDFAGAADVVERLEDVATAPRWLVRRERGRLQLLRKRARDAVEDLERAASLQPDDAETRFLLLSAHLDTEDGAAAGRVLRDVLKRFPGQPVADMSHGRVHFYNDRPKDALLSFRTARDAFIESDAAPREVGEAMYWIGRVHYYNGELDEARDSLRDAISRNPASGDAYYVLGQVEFESESLEAAASAYEKATEVHPKNPDSWFSLGETLAQLGRKKPAREALDKYLELAPKGELADEARRLIGEL